MPDLTNTHMQTVLPSKRHRFLTGLLLGGVTVAIVVTSLLTTGMKDQKALMVANTEVMVPETQMNPSLAGAVPFGQNADEIRDLLERIHSSYASQIQLVEQMSGQNSSMMSLYQQTVTPISSLSASSSFRWSLDPLPSASSLSRTSSSFSSSEHTLSSAAYSSSFSTSSSSVSVSPSSSAFSVATSSVSSSVSSSSFSVVSSLASSEPPSSSAFSVTSAGGASSDRSSSSFFSVSPELATLREAFGRTVETLDTPQVALATRLVSDLTLTPYGETSVLRYATRDLPTIPVVPQYASAVYTHFKLLNGAELMRLGVVPNADVDPKDWYAESVLTVNKLGIMKGSGKTGLFEGERTMSQAELAKTLANAMNLASGTLPHPAAQNADVFQTWPAWAKDAVSELRARGIDTSFFRADPEEAVNRLQLARAISESIFRGDSVDVTKARFFADTVTLPSTVQQYVTKMSAFGVMTGNPDTGTFDPYARTNRAQVAKTVAFAIRVKVDLVKALSSSAR